MSILVTAFLMEVFSFLFDFWGKDGPAVVVAVEVPNQQRVYDLIDEMGPGWNLGNTMDAYGDWKAPEDELEWEWAWRDADWNENKEAPITADLITAIHDLGYNTLRMPITWLNHIQDTAPYTISEIWLNRIQEIIDYAYDLGMYVIINVHHDTNYEAYDGGNKNWLGTAIYAHVNNDLTDDALWLEGKTKFGRLWEQVAERFEDYGERLIFEAYNELGIDTFDEWDETTAETSMIAHNSAASELQQIFVSAVRDAGGENTHRWLIIDGVYANIWTVVEESNENSGVTYMDTFQIPDDSKNTAGTNRFLWNWHNYPSFNYFDDDLNDSTYPYLGQSKDYYSNDGDDDGNYVEEFFRMHDLLVNKYHMPVIITEYGAQNKSGLDNYLNINAPGNGRVHNTSTIGRSLYHEVMSVLSHSAGFTLVVWDNANYGDISATAEEGKYAVMDRRIYTDIQIDDPNSNDPNDKIINPNPTVNPNRDKPTVIEVVEATMRGWNGYEFDHNECSREYLIQKIENINGDMTSDGNAAGSRLTEVDPIISISFPTAETSIELGKEFSTEVNTAVSSNLYGDVFDTLIWKSSNPGVATVYNGVITPKTIGETEITAYSLRNTRDRNSSSTQATIILKVVPSTSLDEELREQLENANKALENKREEIDGLLDKNSKLENVIFIVGGIAVLSLAAFIIILLKWKRLKNYNK